jgi:hypothetical protein
MQVAAAGPIPERRTVAEVVAYALADKQGSQPGWPVTSRMHSSLPRSVRSLVSCGPSWRRRCTNAWPAVIRAGRNALSGSEPRVGAVPCPPA